MRSGKLADDANCGIAKDFSKKTIDSDLFYSCLTAWIPTASG